MPTRAATRGSTAAAKGGKAHASTEPSTKKQQMMMMDLPPPVRFGSNNRSSQSVSFNNIIYLAGQHAEDTTQDIKGQAKQVLDTVDKLLAESKSDKTKIIRADIFLKDKSHLKSLNELWEKWIEPKSAPPCTIALVPDFVQENVLLEVVIIAVVSQDYDEEEGEERMETEEQKDSDQKVEKESEKEKEDEEPEKSEK